MRGNFIEMLGKYGFSGERAAVQHVLVRGQHISSVALETTPNPVNGEISFDFVYGPLIPETMPFDDHIPKSIVDDCLYIMFCKSVNYF